MIVNYELVFPSTLEEFNRREFFYPITKNEIESVRDHFILNYYTFLQSEAKQNECARVIPIIVDFLGQVLRCYYVQALVGRSHDADLKPLFCDKSKFANRFLQNELTVDLSGVDALRRGLRKQSFIRKNASILKSKISNRIIKNATKSYIKRNQPIVTIASGELINKQASSSDGVVYVGLENWFSNINDHENKFVGKISDTVFDGIINIVNQTFVSHGQLLEEKTRIFLEQCLIESFKQVDRYIGSILTDHHYIPKQLWRGTGGLIWSRILSFCTQEIGGAVIGHDHSHGQGAWVSNSDQIIEYPYCDKFYVWTENQKSRCIRNISDELKFDYNIPDICVSSKVQEAHNSENTPLRKRNVKINKTRIMYVSSIYVLDRVLYSPLYPGVSMIDWEIRFFQEAIRQNLEVIYKPHPGNHNLNEKTILEEIGIKVLYDKFEDLFDEFDVAIFSQINSSSFFNCLKTSKPIILATPPLNCWHFELQPLVQARCVSLDTEIDAESRLQTDWTKLNQKIQEAKLLSDSRLLNQLYSGEKA